MLEAILSMRRDINPLISLETLDELVRKIEEIYNKRARLA
jgi:hypothetical protein